MRRHLLTLCWLTAVWVALWDELTLANVLAGAAVGAGLLTVFPDAGPRGVGTVKPIGALRYVLHFAWLLVKANVEVAWQVVTPRSRIAEGVVAVPIQGPSEALVTLVANSITLTPGTLTLEVRREERGIVLYVHVLQLRDPEDVRQEVRHLEYLAIEGFGSPAARAANAASVSRSDVAAGSS